jgi:hypothetical protein
VKTYTLTLREFFLVSSPDLVALLVEAGGLREVEPAAICYISRLTSIELSSIIILSGWFLIGD